MCFILICVGMFHIFLNIFDIFIYMFDMLIDISICLLICIYIYIYDLVWIIMARLVVSTKSGVRKMNAGIACPGFAFSSGLDAFWVTLGCIFKYNHKIYVIYIDI